MINQKFIITFIVFQLLVLFNYCQTNRIVSARTFINPTGFYKLDGRQKGDEIIGYFGNIQVKLISNSRIVVNFYICNGYMSYTSGSFYDTLYYKNNSAIYKTFEYDSTCKIKIAFTTKGVAVDEQTKDFNYGCGFGQGIVAKAFFRKTSKRVPSNKELIRFGGSL